MDATPLPPGYYIEDGTLYCGEPVFAPRTKDAPEPPAVYERRRVCSWTGDRIPAALLIRVARLDQASRIGTDPAARKAAIRELSIIFCHIAA